MMVVSFAFYAAAPNSWSQAQATVGCDVDV